MAPSVIEVITRREAREHRKRETQAFGDQRGGYNVVIHTDCGWLDRWKSVW